MSFSSPEEKEKSIENGLQIAEFIQENRETIQKTYGRSTIDGPRTKERTKAWESFIERKNQDIKGHKRINQSKSDTVEGEGGDNILVHSNASRGVPDSKAGISESNEDGNNSNWDVETPSGSSWDWQIVHGKELTHNHRGELVVSSGTDELEGSYDSDEKDDGGAGGSSGDLAGDTDLEDQKTQQTGIKETTPEDLVSIMEETKPLPKKRLSNMPKIRKITEDIPGEENVIKKTTEENTVYIPLETGSSSIHGATLSAQESSQLPQERSVNAENVHQNAKYVRMSSSDSVDNLSQGSESLIAKKIDTILENQEKILSKLSLISEIKEEISGIKKVLSNQSLAISTVEKYISDLMIIIPKSGLEEEAGQPGSKVNPDLRMVIGRDRNRGLKEMTKGYDPKEKIEIDESMSLIPQVDDKYILKEIDNKKNNAANFKPSDDEVSLKIIMNIIKKEVTDESLRQQLIDMVNENMGSISLNDMYESIKEVIYQN
nr:phosphoprotein [Paramyxoviridae sp.]